jgi:hypothetical protein
VKKPGYNSNAFKRIVKILLYWLLLLFIGWPLQAQRDSILTEDGMVYLDDNCLPILLTVDSIAEQEECAPLIMDVDALVNAPEQLLYQKGGLKEIKRSEPFVGGWFFIINLLLLFLFVFKVLFYGDYTRKSWNAWINNNLFFQFAREKRSMNAVIFMIETILKLYVIAVLFFLGRYLYLAEWHLKWAEFRNLMLILLIFFALKQLISFFLTMLTDQLEEFRILELNSIVFASNLIWFIIPAYIIIVYSDLMIRPYLVYALFALIFLALIAFIYKSLMVAVKMKIRFNIHFFIYLCALEILPFLFLGKTLQNFEF